MPNDPTKLDMKQMWRGIDVISRYDDTSEVKIIDDTLLCGGPDVEKIRAEDAATLLRYGWFWAFEHKSWGHYLRTEEEQ